MGNEVVRIEQITKSFGAYHVLKGIDLSLHAGEVTVLMGANGAGKSTLVKILSGVHRADAGTVTLTGSPFKPLSPQQARAAGVVTVHQNINDGVVANLDVVSNLLLDRLTERRRGFFLNFKGMHREAKAIAAAVGLDVPLHQPVTNLSLADRQLVAIARAMNHNPHLLILDEPTSSLSASEAERLFALIDDLRARGVCILYISHRMSDIRRIADRIVSMRDGRITGTFEGESLDYEGAVNAMLGHTLSDAGILARPPGRPVLRLRDVKLRPTSVPFDLTLHTGEVVAVTGLVGSGKTELAEILFGLRRPAGGEMRLENRPYTPATARDAIERGVFLCAKDRSSNAVIPDFKLRDNLTLPFLARYSQLSFLNMPRQRRRSRELIRDMAVVCQSEEDRITRLSGGNQQKIVVGRWLSETARVLVLDEPFQGVDIKSRRDIGRTIRESADDRATIVMAAELDEVVEIADRIVVLSDHTIVGEHLNEAIDINRILAQVAGQPAEAALA